MTTLKPQRHAFIYGALLLTLIFAGSARGQADSYLRAEHKKTVASWLKSRPGLRLAVDTDNSNKQGLASIRKDEGRGYHPYYAMGDFNGDGKEDFVVAFIKTSRSKLPFTIAIFNGPLSDHTAPVFTFDDDLRSGGIFYKPQAKPKEGRLIVGVFESDDCVILQPRGKTYAMKNCLGD